MANYLFSSESVTEGHPDKMADQISDAVLDAVMEQDKKGRVACETFVTTGLVLVGGEITTECYVDIPSIARNVVKKIGYNNCKFGFDYQTCSVITTIDQQSPDIAMGVDREGAGDQGMMFGYACRETPELMPLPIALAHKLTLKMAETRKSGLLPFLKPDGKSQVSIRYIDGKPVGVEKVVISSQHAEDVSNKDLQEGIMEEVIKKTIPVDLQKNSDIEYFINPTGRFVVGGPMGDAGLTGRKIIVDTYGGMYSHGGGAFSGKDPTKVDRSACYFARYVAKNVVAAGLAERCGIQVAYAIGISKPVSLLVDTFGTGIKSDEELADLVESVFDFTPHGIIEKLDLRRPIYYKTAAYGHFGRELPEFTWEKTDMINQLKG
ncbi:MAG TPA: methionine adenosyltransferase [Caldithrix sp.]|nr:methionine adenosyltransferase [Calditrichaceae bacterium]HEM49199.1 methionine adenosyltransferase [Caldithrix sp.]